MSLLSDVEALRKSPLPEVRETIAQKICEYFNNGVFEEKEELLACEIIRLFARDVELRVRKALSETLKNNPSIPHDVALRLANDEVKVAMPMLEFSMALTEGDIIEIIRSTENIGKLIAISKRESITEHISSALIHKRKDEVVVSLLGNKNANIPERSLIVAVEEFAQNSDVINSLIDRGGLSVGVVEKMIALTSEKLRKRIEEKLGVTTDNLSTLINETREKATVGLLYNDPVIDPKPIKKEEPRASTRAEQLAKHLHSQKRLTSSIILRAICEGNLDFFETSLSIISAIPLVNVRALVRSGDKKALRSLFQRANFPVSVTEAVSVIIEFTQHEKYQEQRFSQSMKQKLMEHITANGYDSKIQLMPYIMALISSDLTVSSIEN
jgi:uncharacterized protein (DUF2336 family)